MIKNFVFLAKMNQAFIIVVYLLNYSEDEALAGYFYTKMRYNSIKLFYAVYTVFSPAC